MNFVFDAYSIRFSASPFFSVTVEVALSPKVADNVSRAGDRNPVLRLRQGYGACTLLRAGLFLYYLKCLFQILTNSEQINTIRKITQIHSCVF